MTRPDEGEEWWKPPPATVTEVEMNGEAEVQSDSQESPVSEGDPQVQVKGMPLLSQADPPAQV